VSAIDAFADSETIDLADSTSVVAFDHHGFKADALLQAISAINTRDYLGFVYGSGFEAQPELLQKIAAILPLLGNVAATVQSVKTADVFFAVLRQWQIPFPAVMATLARMQTGQTYLKKFAAGCGGTHIRYATQADTALPANCYFQQQLSGRAVSLLFIANKQRLQVIGFNEQWLCPTKQTPFRYGGAVSHIALTPEIKQQLIVAAEKLTRAFGLVGLNSLDTIVHGEVAYVLEINPRLTATVDLYEHENLLQRHVQACQQQEGAKLANYQVDANLSAPSKAHAVVYALTAMSISAAVDWPSWAVDIAQIIAGVSLEVAAGDPICSVVAMAADAESCKQLALTRVRIMQELLH
jgi:predicted ATP-grasp superfamily ATP-dependent carboligase